MELDDLLEDFKRYHNAIKEVNISDWKETLGILASPLSKVEVKEDGSIGSVIKGKYGKAYSYLLEILTEYEQIKSAEPTKALECLRRISIKCHPKSDGHTLIDDDLETIKQALIEVEHNKKLLKIYEQENKNLFDNITTKSNAERCWEIVVKKNVNWYSLSKDLKDIEKNIGKIFDYDWYKFKYLYYHYGDNIKILTKEEFNLLKREVGK